MNFSQVRGDKTEAMQIDNPDAEPDVQKTPILKKRAQLINQDARVRKRSIFPGQEIEVWWEVKNLHFREWGSRVTVRCLNHSDFQLPPIPIDK